MANTYTSHVIVHGPEEDVAAFRALAFHTLTDKYEGTDYLAFDLGRIVPKPEIVDQTTSGSYTDWGVACIIARGSVDYWYGWSGRGFPGCDDLAHQRIVEVAGASGTAAQIAARYLEKTPAAEKQGRLALQCLAETGYLTWYEWNRANWGVRGPACMLEVLADAPLTFRFQTSNGFPIPVFERAAELFPTLSFDMVGHDEGALEPRGGWFNPVYGMLQFDGERTDDSDDAWRRIYGVTKAEREAEREG